MVYSNSALVAQLEMLFLRCFSCPLLLKTCHIKVSKTNPRKKRQKKCIFFITGCFFYFFFLSLAVKCGKLLRRCRLSPSLFLCLKTLNWFSSSVSISPCSCLNHEGDSLITFDSLTCHRWDNMTCKHTKHAERSACAHARACIVLHGMMRR